MDSFLKLRERERGREVERERERERERESEILVGKTLEAKYPSELGLEFVLDIVILSLLKGI